MIIENHYSQKAGYFKPMDIEWGKDGKTGELFILQPVRKPFNPRKMAMFWKLYNVGNKGAYSYRNERWFQNCAGPVHVIETVSEIKKFRKGEVLVSDMTDPDWNRYENSFGDHY